MEVTKNVARYIHRIGINTSELSRKIGASYASIYRSVGLEEPKRELKADEFMAICCVLEMDPMYFAEGKEK